MEDPEVVAAIVAGDPAGLAEAYDRYAMPLYSYCRSMLREPADAADAVQDTFLVATAKLRDLRDPAKLRPWLYAVARNECVRRLRTGTVHSALEEAGDVPSQAGEIGAATERAELQELVRAAIDGLNPGERDVIELSLVAELDGDELAEALGVTRNHAHALLSRARSQLERSLGALIVARTGRHACADLEAILTDWDGQMTVLMRKRISRHIERCDVCGERKRRELSPALFAGLAPVAALIPGFRDQVLRVLADRSPAGLAHRLTVANRAGPFGPSGFPKPVSPPGAAPWQHVLHHPQAAVAGMASSVMVAGAIVVGVISGPNQGQPAPGTAGGSTHGASATASPAPAHGGPSGSNGNNGNNGSSRTGGGQGLGPAGSSGGGATSPGAGQSPGAPSSPGAVGPAAPGGSSTSPGSSSPAAGTLAVSTDQIRLVSVNGTATSTFTITAQGGPVSYSISVGSALLGSIGVSPASGTLAADASATITVTAKSLVAVAGQLTVNPGGHAITVVVSVKLLRPGVKTGPSG
jgi:RNA polymerase sigma factor (sigma-70 family)